MILEEEGNDRVGTMSIVFVLVRMLVGETEALL